MNVAYQKKFLKELSKIPPLLRKEIERFAFETAPSSNTIPETGKIEAMKGYPNYYKIRFGSYRVGIKLKNDMIIFERVLHRKEIYRFFP